MTRPGFARGLGPTYLEYAGFLAWLVLVIASMTAMALVPAFNLLFWPTLWIYDFWRDSRPRNSLDPGPEVRLRPARISGYVWDRELDG